MKNDTWDDCRARGCGGWLAGMEATERDGAILYCQQCKAEHVVTVFADGSCTVRRTRTPVPKKTKR